MAAKKRTDDVPDAETKAKARDAVSALMGDRGVGEYDLATKHEDIGLQTLEAENELRDRLKITPEALEEEFVAIPGDIAYIAGRHARASTNHLLAKVRTARLRALLTAEARQKLMDLGSKATVNEVEAAVDSDDRWVSAQVDEIEAAAMVAVEKGALLAIVAKRDMLVQLGANHRAEMERDPSILAVKRGQRMVESQRRAQDPEDPSSD